MSEHSNLVSIDVDVVRRSHFLDASGQLLPKEEEIALMARVYELACGEASAQLHRGMPIVFSGTCSRQQFKDPVLQFSQAHSNVPMRFFRLEVSSEEEIKKSIAMRARENSVSPIKTLEQYHWALTIQTPWPPEIQPTIVNAARDAEHIAHDIFLDLEQYEVS